MLQESLVCQNNKHARIWISMTLGALILVMVISYGCFSWIMQVS